MTSRVGGIAAALPDGPGSGARVGNDGRVGPRGSSLAAADGLGAPVVTLEDLYGGWDGLERGIDLLVSEVLEPLAAGRAARVPKYDWLAGAWAAPWVLEPPEVLIVEGVGAGARRAAAYASLLIWVEAAESVRKQRALDRDGQAFAPHWDMWAAQEDAMLRPGAHGGAGGHRRRRHDGPGQVRAVGSRHPRGKLSRGSRRCRIP